MDLYSHEASLPPPPEDISDLRVVRHDQQDERLAWPTGTPHNTDTASGSHLFGGYGGPGFSASEDAGGFSGGDVQAAGSPQDQAYGGFLQPHGVDEDTYALPQPSRSRQDTWKSREASEEPVSREMSAADAAGGGFASISRDREGESFAPHGEAGDTAFRVSMISDADGGGGTGIPPAKSPDRNHNHGQQPRSFNERCAAHDMPEHAGTAGAPADGLDAVYLGSERVAATGHIVAEDGLGGEVTIERGEQSAFAVRLDALGCFHWFCGSRKQSAQIPMDTNFVMANRSVDGQMIEWQCYKKAVETPKDAIYLGTEKARGGGVVTVQDGLGNEIGLEAGDQQAFDVRLDDRGFFYWYREGIQRERTQPLRETNWVAASRSADGREITWMCYQRTQGYAQLSAQRPRGPDGPGDVHSAPDAQENLREGVGEAGQLYGKPQHPTNDVASPQQGAVIPRSGWACSCSAIVRAAKRDAPICGIHCPLSCAFLAISLSLGLTGAFWPGLELITDFDSFLEADSESNTVRSAFKNALGKREAGSRRLAPANGANAPTGSMLHKLVNLQIYYKALSPAGLLNLKVLNDIREFERKMRALPGWRSFCQEQTNPIVLTSCDPGSSFINIMWPKDLTEEEHGMEIRNYQFDGSGREGLPLDATLLLAKNGEQLPIFFPKGYINGTVLAMRSLFIFTVMCCTMDDSSAVKSAALGKLNRAYGEFVAKELYPLLTAYHNWDAPDLLQRKQTFQMYFSGTTVSSHDIENALFNDCYLAAGSIVFILVYLTIHTRSLILSLNAIFLSIISIPTAFVVSARISGSPRLTSASFLSLFLIVGLGADVVLVFNSFWNSSENVPILPDGPDTSREHARVKYVYRHAGFACAATTMTTSASFFANLASVLKPLREFGFFMGLCLVAAYGYIFVGFPAACVLNRRFRKFWDRNCSEFSLDSIAQDIEEHTGVAIDHFIHSIIAGQTSLLGLFINKILVPARWVIFLTFGLTPLIFLIWAGSLVEADSQLPAIFPEGHNQNDGKKMAGEFTGLPQDTNPVSAARVCNVKPVSSQQPGCVLNWCYMRSTSQTLGKSETRTCSCVPTSQNYQCTTNITSTTATVATRFVGLPIATISSSFWRSADWTKHLREVAAKANTVDVSLAQISLGRMFDLNTIVQEHWETGTVHVSSFLEAPKAQLQVNGTGGAALCSVEEVCYCGFPECRYFGQSIVSSALSESYRTAVVVPHKVGRRLLQSSSLQPYSTFPGALDPGRRLSGGTGVTLVFGIMVVGGSTVLGPPLKGPDLWVYSDFQPESASVQRHVLRACRDAKQDTSLLVTRSECWIIAFRNWLRLRKEMFPVRATRFTMLLQTFARDFILPSGMVASDLMWFTPEGALRATFIDFGTEVSFSSAPTSFVLRYKTSWNAFVDALNLDAPIGGGTVFHTSRLWIRVEAETAIVQSTMATLFVSAGCGFLGALAFTKDLLLSLIVVLTVTGVTCCLAWFMIILMGWAIGAIEVLGLIVFVGYSITYSLHIAHSYGEEVRKAKGPAATRRRQAVSHAMQSMASAIFGSALTTLGSTCFLFMCTMTIFTKLAAVLFAVTFFALVFALLGLPAALMCIGPLGGICGNYCETDISVDDGSINVGDNGHAGSVADIRGADSTRFGSNAAGGAEHRGNSSSRFAGLGAMSVSPVQAQDAAAGLPITSPAHHQNQHAAGVAPPPMPMPSRQGLGTPSQLSPGLGMDHPLPRPLAYSGESHMETGDSEDENLLEGGRTPRALGLSRGMGSRR